MYGYPTSSEYGKQKKPIPEIDDFKFHNKILQVNNFIFL